MSSPTNTLVEQAEEFAAHSAGRVLVVETVRGLVFGPFETWAAAVGWGNERYGTQGGFRIEILSRPDEFERYKQ